MYLKLLEKRHEVKGVTSFIWEPETPVKWTAGQYIHYVLHHIPTDDRGSDRFFTNSAAPFEKHLQITTRITTEKGSSFKKKLYELPVGKWIEISIVEGDFVLSDPSKEHVFIAGGIGITPFRSIIAQLNHEKKPINITLLYANHDENIVFKDEFEKIAKNNPNFKIHYILSPEHIDPAKVKEFVPNINKPIFYVSGPEPMVEDLIEMLKKMGISDSKIKGDWFPGYPKEL